MLSNSSRPYVCLRCLSRPGRTFSSSVRRRQIETEQRNPSHLRSPSSGCSLLSKRKVISLYGNDAPKFLQGLITANVSPPSSIPQAPFYSAFLSAQGRLLNDVFVYPMIGPRPQSRNGNDQWPDKLGYDGRQEPGYLIDVDGASAESLLTHLKRHKLRAKVRLRLLDKEEVEVWETWHDDSDRPTHERYDMPPVSQMLHAADARASPSSLSLFGHRYIVPKGDSSPIRDFDDLTEYDEQSYDLRRYLLGVPEGQTELQRDGSFPHQSNIDIMGGIDFRKGCYVGQELTIRTQHTGVVRRRILPVQLYNLQGSEPQELNYDPTWSHSGPPIGASITKADSKGRSMGKWLGGIRNVGLGLCRLEAMADIAVSAEGASWKEGDQFKVMWEAEGGRGDGLGIKAFVPMWMRNRMPAVKPARRVE
ncbi:Aminomethyltransferase folate-binding domain-containing protein [Viridothelium virens]|uniref:Iron-sulfur cluster assembly factor IBA57 homolog, mitochondrial n=1 Tax=Viridothelium virens TaxID=1048519 RepID=A0A6A6HM62_VIRVR|nr:Aminomethyltransferase folate-binding domain-containing protein [Viridothelium virens]